MMLHPYTIVVFEIFKSPLNLTTEAREQVMALLQTLVIGSSAHHMVLPSAHDSG